MLSCCYWLDVSLCCRYLSYVMELFTVCFTLILVCFFPENTYGKPCTLSPGSPEVFEYAPKGTQLDYGSFNGTLGEDIASLTLNGDLAKYCELQNEILVVKSNITRQPSGFLTGAIKCIQSDSTPVSNTINVRVQKIQLTPPKFDKPSYSASISEYYPSSIIVLTVFAKDEDTSTIEYKIVEQDQPEYFRIDGSSGSIYVDQKPDPSNTSLVLNISAQSNGPNNVGDYVLMSSTVTVTINIEDIDDNPPQFQPCSTSTTSCTQPLYKSTLHPGDNSIAEITPGNITAIDLDSGIYADITYAIISGEPSQYIDIFEINSASGSISLLKAVDSTVSSYEMVIEAVESTGKSSTAYFIVTIDEKDDFPPIFTGNTTTAYLQENLVDKLGYVTTDQDGKMPLKLTVTDQDDDTATFAYEVSPSSFEVTRDGYLLSVQSGSTKAASITNVEIKAINLQAEPSSVNRISAPLNIIVEMVSAATTPEPTTDSSTMESTPETTEATTKTSKVEVTTGFSTVPTTTASETLSPSTVQIATETTTAETSISTIDIQPETTSSPSSVSPHTELTATQTQTTSESMSTVTETLATCPPCDTTTVISATSAEMSSTGVPMTCPPVTTQAPVTCPPVTETTQTCPPVTECPKCGDFTTTSAGETCPPVTECPTGGGVVVTTTTGHGGVSKEPRALVPAETLYAVSGSLGGVLAICLIIIAVLLYKKCRTNDTKSVLDSEETSIDQTPTLSTSHHVNNAYEEINEADGDKADDPHPDEDQKAVSDEEDSAVDDDHEHQSLQNHSYDETADHEHQSLQNHSYDETADSGEIVTSSYSFADEIANSAAAVAAATAATVAAVSAATNEDGHKESETLPVVAVVGDETTQDYGTAYPKGDVVLEKIIKQGEFGETQLVTIRNYGFEKTDVKAIVRTLDAAAASTIDQSSFEARIRLMNNVGLKDHENILDFLGSYADAGTIHYAMMYQEKGDLRTYMTSTPDVSKLDSRQMIHIITGIGKGLQFLHANNVVHCHLRAKCIMLDADMNAKIYDYENNEVSESKDDDDERERWQAVEVLENELSVQASDIWSYGVLMWEVATGGATPYEEVPVSDLRRHVVDNSNRLEQPSGCSDVMFQLMESCWNSDPRFRPDIYSLNANLSEKLLEDPSDLIGMGVTAVSSLYPKLDDVDDYEEDFTAF